MKFAFEITNFALKMVEFCIKALLYNTRRNATIIADTDCVCLELNQEEYFVSKSDEFCIITSNSVVKTRNFAFKMMDFAFKMMDFAAAECSARRQNRRRRPEPCANRWLQQEGGDIGGKHP